MIHLNRFRIHIQNDIRIFFFKGKTLLTVSFARYNSKLQFKSQSFSQFHSKKFFFPRRVSRENRGYFEILFESRINKIDHFGTIGFLSKGEYILQQVLLFLEYMKIESLHISLLFIFIVKAKKGEFFSRRVAVQWVFTRNGIYDKMF